MSMEVQKKFFWRTRCYARAMWVMNQYIILEDLHEHNALERLPDRTGHVAVVVGASRGMGAYVVNDLLQCGFHVILGSRNPMDCKAVVQSVRSAGIHEGRATIIPVDLSSLASTRKFANTILKKTDRIDFLFNHAGIFGQPYALTEDGNERQFQVNFLSHVLITKLLLKMMQDTSKVSSTASRIVFTSSIANYMAEFDPNDIQQTKYFNEFNSYYVSKLYQIMYAVALDKKLSAEDGRVRVFALHPAVANTNLYNAPGWFFSLCRTFLGIMASKGAEHGADGLVFAALAAKLENRGGLYLENCITKRPNEIVFDENSRKILTDHCDKLLEKFI